MTLLQAFILGMIQGLSEFFPVSSSAHLRLAKWFLHISDGESLLYFDLMCHAGTLVALMSFLWPDVQNVLKCKKKIALFSLALLPLIPAYFLLKPIRLVLSNPSYLGGFLFLTSVLLFVGCRLSPKNDFQPHPKKSHVLCIGMAQACALIPGLSRSGATMAVARFLGWPWKEAARFSFLLAIPAILGGEVLETIKLMAHPEGFTLSPLCYAVGFLASLIFGWMAIRFAFSCYEKGRMAPFAWYCLGASFVAWAAFHG